MAIFQCLVVDWAVARFAMTGHCSWLHRPCCSERFGWLGAILMINLAAMVVDTDLRALGQDTPLWVRVSGDVGSTFTCSNSSRACSSGDESCSAALGESNPFAEVLEEIKKMLALIVEEGKQDKEYLDWGDTEREENDASWTEKINQIVTQRTDRDS